MSPRADRDDRILTLDLATELGWCFGRPSDEPLWGHHHLKAADLGHKLILLDSWLRQRIDVLRPELVVYEEPPNPRWAGGKTNAQTITMLNAFANKCEEVCARKSVDCKKLRADQWKRLLCGTSRISKDMKPYPPIEQLAQRGWPVTNHNAADAMGLWLFAVNHRAPKLAMRFDPLARKLAKDGRCFAAYGWCSTHNQAAVKCKTRGRNDGPAEGEIRTHHGRPAVEIRHQVGQGARQEPREALLDPHDPRGEGDRRRKRRA